MIITALIFDLGGVVFDYSFDKTFDTWTILTGKSVKELKSRFKFTESFEKFERNDISPQQFIEDISKQLSYNFDESTFEKGWNSIYMNTFGDIDNLLGYLKENYRLIALTNTNLTHSKVWKIKYVDTLQNFEKIFCSHEIRTRKPETKAFQTVLDYLDVSAQQTIFFDDNKEYVRKAKQIGINAYCVSSYNQMLQVLEKLEIKIR
jgi:glucose-1-phosphatase